jgi:excisionase family DNA binding protein
MSNTPLIPNKLTFRYDEVAKILGVSIATIYYWHSIGKLPAIKRVGKPMVFSRDEILKLIN